MPAPVDSSAAVHRTPTLGHIRSLDGIRAVAVGAVVLYHAGIARLQGGFLGVDVFFVLSGFLITSLLVTELASRNTLAFGRFYERRARRLLPALVVLVGIVVIYAYVITPHGSYPSLPAQILGTMAYVGNWTLIAHHATYFSLGLPASPLEHTWSLAIEEQFYLVWPAVLFCLWRLTKRNRTLALCCVAGSIACAVLTALQFSGSASINTLYLSTQTHATTMLMGAALALLLMPEHGAASSGPFVAAPVRAATIWNVTGVVAWLAVVAMFFMASGTGSLLYRGGYVGVGAVVALAIGATVLVPLGWSARVLSLAPLVFIGQISYGIYLFHFPLFLWIDHASTGLSGLGLLAVRIIVTIAAATVSYVLVERPIRQRRFLRGWAGLWAAVGTYLVVSVLAFSVTSSAAFVPFADRIARWVPIGAPPRGTSTRILIAGDSMAQTLGNGLDNPLTRYEHVYVSILGESNCSVFTAEMRIKGFHIVPRAKCSWTLPNGMHARWTKRLHSLHPDVSLMLFRLDVVDHKVDRAWTHVGEQPFDCLLRRRLISAAATLAATGRPVVLLTTPYYSTGEQPSGATWPEDDPARVRAYNDLLRSVAAQFPGVVHVVDLNAMVSPHGRYARVIGSTVVRWVDGVHFTYAGDSYVLPRLLAAVTPIARTRPSRAALDELEAVARVGSPLRCSRG